MPVFATFDQSSYYGGCPNVAKSATPPSSSPLDRGAFGRLQSDCTCHDTSFGGIIDLKPVNDEDEPFPKARRARGRGLRTGAARRGGAVAALWRARSR